MLETVTSNTFTLKGLNVMSSNYLDFFPFQLFFYSVLKRGGQTVIDGKLLSKLMIFGVSSSRLLKLGFFLFLLFSLAPSVGILRLVAVHSSGKEGVPSRSATGEESSFFSRFVFFFWLHPLG